MNDVKKLMLDTKYFVDNIFLDEYCTLVSLNKRNSKEIGKTQKHHVIPVCCYKSNKKLTHREILKIADSDINNFKINLSFQDHIKVHYYLCKCCTTEIFPRLFNALDKQLRGNPHNKTKRTLQQIEQIIKDGGLVDYQELYEKAKAAEFKSVICIETQQVFKSVKEASL